MPGSVRRLPDAPLTPAQRALTASPEARGMLARLAARLHARFRDLVSLEDLAGAGRLALTEAARTYAPALGTPFDVFAWSRVHGAMLRLVRVEGRLARLSREASYCVADVAREEGDPWNDGEAEHGAYLAQLSDTLVAAMMIGAVGEGTRAAAAGPEAEVSSREVYARTVSVLEHAVAALPEPDPALIRMVYRESRTLHEASQALGLSYATGRRTHARALARLSIKLRAAGVAGPPSRPAGGGLDGDSAREPTC
jgi:RNA polymerase sigma factor for flagellar operon FliA